MIPTLQNKIRILEQENTELKNIIEALTFTLTAENKYLKEQAKIFMRYCEKSANQIGRGDENS